MPGSNHDDDRNETLREKAEREIRHESVALDKMSESEIESLIYELRVHQIELQMQNEQLHQTQVELEESRSGYSDLFEFAPIGYFILDHRGCIVTLNLTAAQMIGRDRKYVVGKPLARHVSPKSREVFMQHRLTVFESGQSQQSEIDMVHADGHILTVSFVSQPVTDAQGRVIHSRSAMMDITELKAREAELVRTRDELVETSLQLKDSHAALEQRARQLARLASELNLTEQRERQRIAKILHDDLQQLLVSAKFTLGAVQSQVHEEPVLTEIKTVCELINESIAASRSLTTELSPVILQRGLVAGLKWLGRWMEQKHKLKVELRIEDPIETGVEFANEVLLYEMVRELLFNVVKHAQTDAALVELGQSQGRFRLVVSDLGKGFDAAAMWKRTADKGTGFGLFSIQERLTLLGGSLTVESRPSQGARFTVTLPLKRIETAPGMASAPAEPDGRIDEEKRMSRGEDGRIRLLLVDDHPVLRQGLATMLNREKDIDVVAQAANGQEAVNVARQTHPDVILMDCNMPVMDGINATRIIHSEMPETQIIGLSMYNEAEFEHAMKDAGAQAYLSKSSPIDILLKEIRAAV